MTGAFSGTDWSTGMAAYFKDLRQLIERKLPKDREAYVSAVQVGARLAKAERAMGRSVDPYRKQVGQILSRMAQAGYRTEVDWWRAYFHYHIQEFDRARELFLKAETDNADRERYWMDRGRAEYNTGRLTEALHSFNRGFTLARRAGQLEGQHFRWLAKTNRWLGHPRAEADALHGALEHMWQQGSMDRESLMLAAQRLPRAMLLSDQPEKVLDFIQEWYTNDHGRHAELSAEKVEALYRLGRAEEAMEYATRTAAKFRNGDIVYFRSMGRVLDRSLTAFGLPREYFDQGEAVGGGDIVLATALAHSNLPFTAHGTLLTALKDAATGAPLLLVNGEDPDSGEAGMTPVEVEPEFLKTYQAACRAIETGRADLATHLLFEAAEIALKQASTYPLSYCLQRLNEVAMDHPRLAQLHVEAVQRFPEDYLILVHAGRYQFARGNHEEALGYFQRTAAASRSGALIAESLVAETLGMLGDDAEALRLFRELLARNWRTQMPDMVAQGVFTPAMRWAERSGHHLQALRWADDWVEKYTIGVVTYKDAVPIYLSAGRSALSIGEPLLAYRHFKRAAATYAAWLIEPDTAQLRLRDMARANALVALAALLAGELDDVEPWLATARSQAGDLDVVSLVSALSLARSGDVPAAHALLVDSERTPLWAHVARLVAPMCRAEGRDDLAAELERKALVVEGQAPTPEEALARLDAQAASLIEARREAEDNRRFQQTARDVFEALVVRSGLLPEDHAAYGELKKAIDIGKPLDPDRIAASVLRQLDKRLRQEGIRGDVCEQRMGAAWAALNPTLRELLSLTQDHVAYAEQHALKDYGPALMYLAKTVEELLRGGVATVLECRASSIHAQVPWREFTLGCASRRMWGRVAEASRPYRQMADGVIRSMPEPVRTYMGRAWEEDARLLADARNDWAHRQDVISRRRFDEVLSAVVGAPETRTVLGATLTLRRILES